MSEIVALVLSLLEGALLGIFFFGGLWWTIRTALKSKRPAVLFGGSLLLRTTTALFGFYLVSHGDWRRLLGCLSGFMLSRFLVARIARAPIEMGFHAGGGS
jgi:F1F0 ATPase subunit 2